MKVPQIALETSSVFSGLVVLLTTTIFPQPHLSAIGAGTMFTTWSLASKQDKEKRQSKLTDELEQLRQSLENSETQARALESKLSESERVSSQVHRILEDFAQANAERKVIADSLKIATAQLEQYSVERKRLLNDLEIINRARVEEMANVQTAHTQEVTTIKEHHEQQRREWSTKFDNLINDYETKLDDTNKAMRDMERELNRFRDSKDIIVENATLLVGQKAKALEEKVGELDATNRKLSAHVGESASIITELQGEFQYLTSEGFAQLQEMHAEQLALCQRELAQLQTTLAKCQAPQLFDQIGDYARADKLITKLYELTGAVLDASEITPIDDGAFEVALNVRDRKARGVSFVKSLTDMGEVLMVDVSCIEPLKFEFDAQNPHRILTKLRYRKAVANVKALPWKTREQFVSIAGKWTRVRVTGGSESGKSPLAELIVAAMQQVKGAMSVSLAFPLTDSVKNNWTLKVTHSDGYKGVLECARETVAMVKTHPPQFHVSVLDECDTSLKEYRDLAGEVKELIKTGSHANVGVILLGQNANVKQWTGFDRSDFENIVNVHIGTNAYHALENSNLSQTVKDKLKGQADKLVKHCETVNAGVDEPDKMTRFALVVDPTKTPYFIELPVFGSLNFDYSKVTTTPENVAVDAGVKCTHCGGEKYKRNGTYANGDARYKCLDKGCGKAFR